MGVELPFAPVDSIIRRNANGLRVSAGATEALANRIQLHGARIAVSAAELADADGRKTLMASDFPSENQQDEQSLTLPVAPVDRIARLEIEDRYLVSEDARVALAHVLEQYAKDVAAGAAVLARHADRRTITRADIETYFELVDGA